MKQAKQIFRDAMFLTLTALFMRTAGVWFQIVVSNRAGAEVMGLYALMSGVYGFALTLATSGIHLGVTRVVAEMMSRGKSAQIRGLMKRAVCYALFFGLLSSLLLAVFAERISLFWIKDARVIVSLRCFAVTLPMISLSSVFGGYFTAVRRSTKSAIGQITEQSLRIFFSMHLLAWTSSDSTERLLCALVLGGAAAEGLSFLLELTLYLIDRKRHFPPSAMRDAASEGRQLIHITLPIALTTYARSGLLTLEHILIPEGLRNSGASHATSLVAYGSIHSMALPIILYPAALIASFSGLLIPAMAECKVSGSRKRICYMVSRVWHFSMIYSIGVAGVLICFSSEFGEVLYPGTQTGDYIRMLAPLIPIMYVDTATDAMLKGLGEQLRSMIINIADALISVILVFLLVPRFGITGYLVTIYISELFNTVLSVHRLLKVTGTTVHLLKWVYLPLLSVVGSTLLSKVLLELLPWNGLSLRGTILPHCLMTLLIYAAFLLLTHCVGKEERAWLRTLFRKNDVNTTSETEDGSGIPRSPSATLRESG